MNVEGDRVLENEVAREEEGAEAVDICSLISGLRRLSMEKAPMAGLEWATRAVRGPQRLPEAASDLCILPREIQECNRLDKTQLEVNFRTGNCPGRKYEFN